MNGITNKGKPANLQFFGLLSYHFQFQFHWYDIKYTTRNMPSCLLCYVSLWFCRRQILPIHLIYLPISIRFASGFVPSFYQWQYSNIRRIKWTAMNSWKATRCNITSKIWFFYLHIYKYISYIMIDIHNYLELSYSMFLWELDEREAHIYIFKSMPATCPI